MGIVRLNTKRPVHERRAKVENVMRLVNDVMACETPEEVLRALRKFKDVLDNNKGKHLTVVKMRTLCERTVLTYGGLSKNVKLRAKAISEIRAAWSEARDALVEFADSLKHEDEGEVTELPDSKPITDLEGQPFKVFNHTIVFLTDTPPKKAPASWNVLKYAASGYTADATILAVNADTRAIKTEAAIVKAINALRKEGKHYVNLCSHTARETGFFRHPGSPLAYAWIVKESEYKDCKLKPANMSLSFDTKQKETKPNTEKLADIRKQFEEFLHADEEYASLLKLMTKQKPAQGFAVRGAKPLSPLELHRKLDSRRTYLLNLFRGEKLPALS